MKFLFGPFFLAVALLPFIVDLNKTETERLEFFGRDFAECREAFFVRGAAMLFGVPRAKTRRLRRQVDVILLRHRVGPGFQT